jgi:hypothetical protein
MTQINMMNAVNYKHWKILSNHKHQRYQRSINKKWMQPSGVK